MNDFENMNCVPGKLGRESKVSRRSGSECLLSDCDDDA